MNDKEIIQNNYSFAGCCVFINTTKNKFYVEKSDCVFPESYRTYKW